VTQLSGGAFLPSTEEIEREAATWLAKLDKTHNGKGVTVDLEAYATQDPEFDLWLKASVGHRVALLRLLSVWKRTGRLQSATPANESLAEVLPLWSRVGHSKAWGALAASILIIFSLISMNYYLAEPAMTVYQTARGGQQLVPLSDGSRINLNSDTRLDADMTAGERIIILERGEAFFEVSRDEKRPFKIYTGNEVITVLGTKFAVHRRDHGVEVAVTEGRVQVECLSFKCDSTASTAIMTAGDVAKTDNGHLLVENKGVDAIARDLSWRQGFIDFDQASLEEAAEEFNRYNAIELVIEDADIARIPVSGKFRTDNLDAFVRFLTEGFGFQVVRKDTQILVFR
tara:strand:+ start:5197 stop:6225 length:1029 start_codon:yes stop_codon:yes gene_type:complete